MALLAFPLTPTNSVADHLSFILHTFTSFHRLRFIHYYEIIWLPATLRIVSSLLLISPTAFADITGPSWLTCQVLLPFTDLNHIITLTKYSDFVIFCRLAQLWCRMSFAYASTTILSTYFRPCPYQQGLYKLSPLSQGAPAFFLAGGWLGFAKQKKGICWRRCL